MTKNTKPSKDINFWDAIKSGLFDNKLEEFNRLYPEVKCVEPIGDIQTFQI
jgi:hypothetical protein